MKSKIEIEQTIKSIEAEQVALLKSHAQTPSPYYESRINANNTLIATLKWVLDE